MQCDTSVGSVRFPRAVLAARCGGYYGRHPFLPIENPSTRVSDRAATVSTPDRITRASTGVSTPQPGAAEHPDTLLRSAEERLERSISLLQAALDSTADGILVVDLSGRVVRTNRRFAEIWGIPEGLLSRGDDAALLRYVLDQVEAPDAFLERVESLYGEPSRTGYDVIRFRDGRVIERYSRPQRVGPEVVGRVWSFRDVTEQKRMQEALISSERRYRRLFEESRHALYITTRDGDFVDVNHAMLELLGHSRQDLLRLNARDLYAHEEDRKRFQREVEERLRAAVRHDRARIHGSLGPGVRVHAFIGGES